MNTSEKPRGYRKHWTHVERLTDGVWLAYCQCGTWQLEVCGERRDAVSEAKRHQAVAEYRERVAA